MKDLERLKEFYAPPKKRIDIVEQARIIAEALEIDGEYVGRKVELAEYLGISPNKLYKLSIVHRDLIQETKEWLKQSPYQMSTAYYVSQLPPMAQLEWLENAKIAEG